MTIQRAVDAAAATPERRAHSRVPVALPGKLFLPATDDEQDCVVLDLSLDGAKLQCDGELSVGTELVLYLPGFDRFGGAIVWSDKNFSGMKFDCSEAKRERTAQHIVLYLTGVRLPETQQRRTARVSVPAPRHFTRPNGEVVNFDVLDISLSSASLKTMARPPIGEIVTVGNTPGRVSRHFDTGIALEFVR
jgi:PilZ domain